MRNGRSISEASNSRAKLSLVTTPPRGTWRHRSPSPARSSLRASSSAAVHFEAKAGNATDAGVEAVIIYNRAGTVDAPIDPNEPVAGNLTTVDPDRAPTVGIIRAQGEQLIAGGANTRVSLDIETVVTTATTTNIFAESRGATPATSSWSAATSTASRRAPASTTTARAPPPSSRSPRIWPACRSSTRSASPFWGAEELGLVGSQLLRRQPVAGGARQDRPLPQLRHGGVAELRALRLRRQQRGQPGRRAWVVGHRGPVQRLLRWPWPRHRPDRVRRTLRLRAVHRRWRRQDTIDTAACSRWTR